MNISHFIKRYFQIRLHENFKKMTTRISQSLQNPLVITIILISFFIHKVPLVKFFITATFNIPQHESDPARKYLNDIIRFTNENMEGRDILLLVPFSKVYFKYYTKHKMFIDNSSPLRDDGVLCEDKTYDVEDILRNDLNYRPENFFENSDSEIFLGDKIWDSIWENLDEKMIKRLREKYKVTHVIRENNLPLNFPILHRNPCYTIYKIEQ